MFRKLTFALVAISALGAAALAPTSASAWGYGGGFHRGFHHEWGFRGWGYRGWGYGRDFCYFHPLFHRAPALMSRKMAPAVRAGAILLGPINRKRLPGPVRRKGFPGPVRRNGFPRLISRAPE